MAAGGPVSVVHLDPPCMNVGLSLVFIWVFVPWSISTFLSPVDTRLLSALLFWQRPEDAAGRSQDSSVCGASSVGSTLHPITSHLHALHQSLEAKQGRTVRACLRQTQGPDTQRSIAYLLLLWRAFITCFSESCRRT